MREPFPPSPALRARPSRVRVVSELWLRAYWRYYLLTAIWVMAVTLLFPIR